GLKALLYLAEYIFHSKIPGRIYSPRLQYFQGGQSRPYHSLYFVVNGKPGHIGYLWGIRSQEHAMSVVLKFPDQLLSYGNELFPLLLIEVTIGTGHALLAFSPIGQGGSGHVFHFR